MKKIVVLTGPTGHLGSAMLTCLLSGFCVIGISRQASLMSKILPNECSLKYMPLDFDFRIDSAESVAAAVAELILCNNGELVGIVNNAFFSYPSSSLAIDKISVADCAEGLFGYWVRLSLLMSDHMTTSASIVNISSMYAHVSPQPSIYQSGSSINPLIYGSMKAALIQASRYLSSQLGPRGIRVNSVSFGPFPSQSVQVNDPEFISRLASRTHLCRIGKPEEAGAVVKFLVSSDSSYITGADIAVDGGWTAW